MCAECGTPGNACEVRFQECIAREFEDPRYGRVHHLTVSAYMLQHSSRLTREGWLYERELLRDFLVGNRPPEQVRKEEKDIVDSGKRTFKIKTRTRVPVISRTIWSRTVLDVRLEKPQEYCEDVAAWAGAALLDAQAIELV